MPAIITVEHLSKRYRIGALRRHNSFRDLFDEKLRMLFSRAEREAAAKENAIWALKDVSFELNEGEVLGIIGRNGAGKSTMLKLLARITEPTEGKIRMRGRVASLLEVGTGFSPELTGRENIYLNGAILGMRKSEIDRKFDEIVDFSEIGRFIDTPVKRYSSGMFMRLAFAVAAHLEPEILIVDEVLAVGDAQFQEKCLRKMEDIGKSSGRTVLFVSHNIGAITNLCTRVVHLHQGRIVHFGETNAVVAEYLHSDVNVGAEKTLADPASILSRHREFGFTKVGLKDHLNNFSSELDVRFPMTVAIEYFAAAPLHNVEISVRIFAYDGRPVFTSHQSDSQPEVLVQRLQGTYGAAVTIPGTMLVPGDYYISIEAHIPTVTVLEKYDHIIKFHVNETGSKLSRYQPHQYMQGVIIADFPWNESRVQ
ncbi:MAG TPA: ABC transporter ATP-binding protein [Bacteroidota bacterium]|nr:ABC transporter ATP-binding protein [Bacteroidota bacterium]